MRIQVSQILSVALLTTTIFWVLCSLLVWLMPEGAAIMTTAMFHMEVLPSQWHLTLGGSLLGLGCWLLATTFITWLAVSFYNRLVVKS